MIRCGENMVGKGEREGEGLGSPSGQTLVSRWKWRIGNKKHSYITISDRT